MTCTLVALPAEAVTPVGAPGIRPSSWDAPPHPHDTTSARAAQATRSRRGPFRTALPPRGRHHGNGPDQYDVHDVNSIGGPALVTAGRSFEQLRTSARHAP